MDDLPALGEELEQWVAQNGAEAAAAALSPHAIRTHMLGSTHFAALGLGLLRTESPGASRIAEAFPDAAALAYPAPAQVEHDAGTDRPLLDHIATRLLGQKLLGLETGARWPGLSSAAFDELAVTWARVRDVGLGPPMRAAILHLDIAKTASESHRAKWRARGINLEVHNEAAVRILEGDHQAWNWGLVKPFMFLTLAWIAGHGLAGQQIRGEGPLTMFWSFVANIRGLRASLAHELNTTPEAAIALALDGLHVLNACDTAAVREGLVDDALLARFAAVRDQLATAIASSEVPFTALKQFTPPQDRQHLADRLRALRAGRQRDGEPAALVDDAIAAIGDTELAALVPALANCQLWYCEAATSVLSPSGQLAILAAAVGAARKAGIDVSYPWHAQLKPLVARLTGDKSRYRVRLVEAALAQRSLRELLAGGVSLGPLGTLSAQLASTTVADAIVIDFIDTEESAALITLLGIYETRSQVAFHQMLKALCDLYGLRKDEFDRVANEASYLATMNAARTDKDRMLDLVKPGRIVEIGPGGGVVLDLLEARFPDAEIIGVDLSREVIAALEQRARVNHRRWKVQLGAAEQLAITDVDTVVFCSILHEVYSYTEPRFQLASVEHVIRAAYASLVRGGRIVIRDGVMPPPGTRRIQFVAPDARPVFDLYVKQFEGRPIVYKDLGDGRVELSTADAMEFLYTYTWGPASFPYEVRELYGIMPYDDYVRSLLAWCPGAVVVENPIQSYLQPGYRDGLVGKIVLTDEHDHPVELPDSNCLIAIEKR
ncbi:MAG: methyltransferase [Kofleriaceae bacterium]